MAVGTFLLVKKTGLKLMKQLAAVPPHDTIGS